MSALDDLLFLIGDDPEFLDKLIRTFIESTVPMLDELDSACARGDVETIRSLTHRLHGSVSNFGAPKLELLCQQLEKLPAGVDGTPFARRIRSEHERLVDSLDHLRRK